jgi:glycogen synthase
MVLIRPKPCGLAQLIAMRAAPSRRAGTGGLADTVRTPAIGGNGFLFDEFSQGARTRSRPRALGIAQPLQWAEIQRRGMRIRFFWTSAASTSHEQARAIHGEKRDGAPALSRREEAMRTRAVILAGGEDRGWA